MVYVVTKEDINMTTLYLTSQNPPQSPFSKRGTLFFPSLAKRGQGRFCNIYVFLPMNLLVRYNFTPSLAPTPSPQPALSPLENLSY